MSPASKMIALLAGLVVVVIGLFLSINIQGSLTYVLSRRGLMVATMILVAFANGISTLLFQTVTNNRILSPSIMGFEALFILIQTLTLFAFGSLSLLTDLPVVKFLAEAGLMILFASILFRQLFLRGQFNLHLLLLIGVICGGLFTSLSSFMQRMIDPGEFSVLQGRMFARFTLVNSTLLLLSAVIVLGIAMIVWRMRYELDIIALGKNSAISLGVNYQSRVASLLILIAILVSVSTALIGPLTFFGFLVTTLTYQLGQTYKHAYLIPINFLLGIVALIGGQLILQHGLDMEGTLSVVLEFIGGSLFIFILLKRVSL